MPVVGIRDLARRTRELVDEVENSGAPAIVTRRGRVVVAVVPIDEEGLEDFVLANAPEYVRSMREADRDLREGRTVSLDAVLEDQGVASRRTPNRTSGSAPRRVAARKLSAKRKSATKRKSAARRRSR